jgi:hypothetical protein
MDEGLSIKTDVPCNPDVALTAPSDTDGNIFVDVNRLSVDPENVAQFRKQLHSKSQSTETENASTVEGKTKHDISESPVLKHSAPNERTLFGSNDEHNPPFVAGKPHPCLSKNQSTDNSRKDFYEKSMEFDINSKGSAPKTADGTMTYTSGIFDAANTSIHTRNLKAVTKELSSGIPSAETFHASENRTDPHSYNGNDTVSANASVTKPTRTKQRNIPEISKPLSKTDNTASASESLPKSKTRERPRSSESTSDMHKTAVIDTIPFLRTPNETVAPVQEPTAAQASKSHAMLIAQQIRDHIIDRILVSSSALNDNRTVTVQLSPRLLRDTEVQFTQNGTSLDIRLVSQNKDSVQFLQQHQSDLQTYLQGELKTYRAISVRIPSSQASAELSQPHDGRSRNRFDYQSADEEETT